MSELTVVLTAHNRDDLIEEMLASLAVQEWDGDWDILFVDNDSTDTTPEILEHWIDKMPVPARLLHTADGHSCAHARNAGAAAVTATSFAFIDDDDQIAPGWVAAMGDALRDHEWVATRFDYTELNSADRAATTNRQTDHLGTHFGRTVVDGGGSGIRTDLWHSVGGNDERLGFAEDTDLSLRIARLERVEPHFCADAVYHVRLRTESDRAWDRGLRRGRCETELYDRYRHDFGLRPDRPWIAVGRWARLAAQIPFLADRDRRAAWVEQLGRRIGRLQQSRRDRVWYP